MSASRLAAIVSVVCLGILLPNLAQAAEVKLQWDPPTDGITTGYVLSYGQSPGSYSWQMDIGLTTSYIVTGLSDGAVYYFVVRAYDSAGDISAPSDEASATAVSTTPPTVTALALSVNLPSPQISGTKLNWLAAAAGGVAPYQFQWSLYQAGAWNIGRWTAASTWSWTPTSAANGYQVRVAVRSSGSASAAGEMSQSMPFVVTAPPTAFTLSTSAFKVKGVKNANLTWRGASGTNVDVYRNGTRISTTTNDGAYTDNLAGKGSGTYTYKVCAATTSTCSNNSVVVF